MAESVVPKGMSFTGGIMTSDGTSVVAASSTVFIVCVVKMQEAHHCFRHFFLAGSWNKSSLNVLHPAITSKLIGLQCSFISIRTLYSNHPNLRPGLHSAHWYWHGCLTLFIWGRGCSHELEGSRDTQEVSWLGSLGTQVSRPSWSGRSCNTCLRKILSGERQTLLSMSSTLLASLKTLPPFRGRFLPLHRPL